MHDRNPRRNRPLQVEALESLTLLSGLAGSVKAPALIEAAAITSSVALNATVKGVYIAAQPKPASGLAFVVTATGQSNGLRTIGVTADLFTPGFVPQGRTTGTVVVYTTSGNLTLQVAGPAQPGFSGLPAQLSFTIVGGTGKFHNHFGGHGTLAISLLTGYAGPKTTTHGQLSMTFTAT